MADEEKGYMVELPENLGDMTDEEIDALSARIFNAMTGSDD